MQKSPTFPIFCNRRNSFRYEIQVGSYGSAFSFRGLARCVHGVVGYGVRVSPFVALCRPVAVVRGGLCVCPSVCFSPVVVLVVACGCGVFSLVPVAVLFWGVLLPFLAVFRCRLISG